jgi:hypothetical protein
MDEGDEELEFESEEFWSSLNLSGEVGGLYVLILNANV